MSEPTIAPAATPLPDLAERRPWYSGVTGYQWLVLAIASAGWLFDNYENQIFVVTRSSLLSELLRQPATSPAVKYYSDSINSVFLIGGATGGVLFGMLADRFGRARSMIGSILVYAIFSALTSLTTAVWQVATLRFFVAMGTGGEWAVAAALVAEVFPPRARAQASGIFHASSVIGVVGAGVAGMLTGSHWRIAYLIGLGPALLVLAVRAWIREPRRYVEAADAGATLESAPAEPLVAPRPTKRGFGEFWSDRVYRRRAIIGLLLAAVGLAGYWCVFAAGQDLAHAFLLRQGVAAAEATRRAKFAYTVVQNIGGGIGLFTMGPLCALMGRRRGFVLMQIGAVVATPLACLAPTTYAQLLWLLPVMAFFVAGMHAGYAVYFPELFPTRLRATGCGLCFNGGRIAAAGVLILSGWLKSLPGMDLRWAVSLLASFYLLGTVLVLFLPETRGQALEE